MCNLDTSDFFSRYWGDNAQTRWNLRFMPSVGGNGWFYEHQRSFIQRDSFTGSGWLDDLDAFKEGIVTSVLNSMRSLLFRCQDLTKRVHGGFEAWTTTRPGASAGLPLRGSFTSPMRARIPNVPAGIDALIVRAARRHELDPNLLRAIAWVESHFNPRAISPVGARGLMQVMPATARRFGCSDPNALLNPAVGIEVGARYLAYLQKQFGSLSQVVPAYNAGEGAVRKHGGQCPPYRETRSYVVKVASAYQQFRQQRLGDAPGLARRAA